MQTEHPEISPLIVYPPCFFGVPVTMAALNWMLVFVAGALLGLGAREMLFFGLATVLGLVRHTYLFLKTRRDPFYESVSKARRAEKIWRGKVKVLWRDPKTNLPILAP